MPDQGQTIGGVASGVVSGAATGAAIGGSTAVKAAVGLATAGAIAGSSVPVLGAAVGAVLALCAALIAAFSGKRSFPAMTDAQMAAIFDHIWDLEDRKSSLSPDDKALLFALFPGYLLTWHTYDRALLDMLADEMREPYGDDRVQRVLDGPLFGLDDDARATARDNLSAALARAMLGSNSLIYSKTTTGGVLVGVKDRRVYEGRLFGSKAERDSIAQNARRIVVQIDPISRARLAGRTNLLAIGTGIVDPRHYQNPAQVRAITAGVRPIDPLHQAPPRQILEISRNVTGTRKPASASSSGGGGLLALAAAAAAYWWLA